MAYIDIQNRIASDLRRDDLTNDIKNAINDAIKMWEGEAFLFNEKRFQLVTIQGQEYVSLSGVSLPANIFPGSTVVITNIDGSAVAAGEQVLEVESMTCKPLSTGLPYPVTARTQAWFDKNQANPTKAQGLPEFYAIFDGGMRIYPVPNANHTLTFSALARLAPVPLVNGTDSNAWVVDGENLIREQSKALLYRDVIRDSEGLDLAHRAIYGEVLPDGREMVGHLTALKRKMSALVMVGRVEPWAL